MTLNAKELGALATKIVNDIDNYDGKDQPHYDFARQRIFLALMEARAEAIEEAAVLVEGRKGIAEHHSDLATLIRSLKTTDAPLDAIGRGLGL